MSAEAKLTCRHCSQPIVQLAPNLWTHENRFFGCFGAAEYAKVPKVHSSLWTVAEPGEGIHPPENA